MQPPPQGDMCYAVWGLTLYGIEKNHLHSAVCSVHQHHQRRACLCLVTSAVVRSPALTSILVCCIQGMFQNSAEVVLVSAYAGMLVLLMSRCCSSRRSACIHLPEAQEGTQGCGPYAEATIQRHRREQPRQTCPWCWIPCQVSQQLQQLVRY